MSGFQIDPLFWDTY